MSKPIKVTMGGVTYDALVHALYAIGFKPNGKPHNTEKDKVWGKARRDLEKHGVCTVIKNNKTYTIHKLPCCEN